jgi:hypothetical protein
MEKGRARSVTQRSPVDSCCSIRRLVGSASAANVRSSDGRILLTIWLTNYRKIPGASTFFCINGVSDEIDVAGCAANTVYETDGLSGTVSAGAEGPNPEFVGGTTPRRDMPWAIHNFGGSPCDAESPIK